LKNQTVLRQIIRACPAWIFAYAITSASLVSASSPVWQWQWSNPLPTGNNLIQIAFSSSNQGIILADNGEILRSSDDGLTWKTTGSGTAQLHFTAAIIRDAYFVAVDNQGKIWKRASTGTSWRATDSLNQSLLDIRACTDALFLAVGRNGLIARSTDRGETWTNIQQISDSPTLVGLHCGPTGHAVAVGDGGLVLLSRDFGAKWESLPAPVPEMLTGVTFADASLGWVTTDQGKVALTRDGGMTWKLQVLDSLYFLRHIHWTQGHLAVTGSDGRVWTSTDRGETWASKPSPTEFYLAASALNAMGQRLIIGNAGIVLRGNASGDGLQIISKGSTKEVQGLTVLSPRTWLAYGDNGLILKSSDSGHTWNEQTGGDHYYAASFKERKGLLVGYKGTLLYSNDEGDTWNPGITPVIDGPLYGIAWSDSNSAIAVGYSSALWRSTDAGHNWQALPPPTGLGDATLSAVCFKPDGTGFIAGYRGTLLTSSNGGANWSQIPLSTQNNLYALAFRDDSVGMAVGARGLVLVTRDGGRTWTSEATGVNDDYLFSALWLGGDTAVVSGAWGHTAIVRMTPDAGKTWVTVEVPTSNLVYSLTKIGSNHIAAVGSRGLILLGQLGPSQWDAGGPGPIGPNKITFSVHRTGFPGLASVYLDLSTTGSITVSTHAMDGRFSETVYRGTLKAGPHRFSVVSPKQRGPTLFRLDFTEASTPKPSRLRQHTWMSP
jgi:photosystem II stability/assembly factor-like uncharacterized protein